MKRVSTLFSRSFAPFAMGMVLVLVVSLSAQERKTWDFEKGLGDWKPWGTSANMGDVSGIVSISEEAPCAGKKSLVISDSFANGNPYAIVVVQVDPSKTYLFSGWVRAGKKSGEGQAATDRPAYGHVWVMPVNKSGGGEKAVKFIGAGGFDKFAIGADWQRFRFLLPKMGPETTHVYLAIRPAEMDDPSWQGKLFVDEVSFMEQSFSPLDVSASVNRGFRDEAAGDGKGGWTDQGNNDLRGMKSGAVNLAGVPFNVLDPEKNAGHSVLALRPKESPAFAAEAVVNVGAPCDFLYLLHAAAWAGSGQNVGSLVWEYADGEKKTVRLVSGDQVGDWWSGVAKSAFSKSFEQANPTKSAVYLFVTSFANPAPDKSVKRVFFQCADGGNAIWLILAATAGTGDNVVESARFASRDYSKWKPFATGLASADKPLLDLSFLLDAPAGKHGFLQSKGGKFVFADGTPGRFMAVNIHSVSGLVPSHEEAERLAKTLSRYGINLVRLHLMEGMLVDRNVADRQTPAGEDTWDRFDYLIKSLKDRGIYVDLDSILGLSGRSFSEADGFEGAKDYAPHRAWAVYHPRLRELGKNWAKIVLTHKNKYTGNALVDEPAVAMTMLINEQSIFFDWQENTRPTPPAIRAILVKLYNHWLVKKYKDRAGLEKAWRSEDGKTALQADEDPAKGNVVCWESYVSILGQNLKEGPTDSIDSALRARNLVLFLKELQRDHYLDMLAFLKSLGVKVPIAGSNILGDVADLETTLATEWTSQNRYYEHVRIVDKSYGFANIPEVFQNPLSGPLVQPGIAASKLNTLPVTSTEHDTMWPQEWRSTHNLSVYASAALQDWDAIFWYCFMGGYGITFAQAEKMTSISYPTVEFNDPALAGLLPTAALMYLRRDVAPAKNLVQVIHAAPMTEAVKSRITSGDFPFNYLTWVSRVEGVFGAQDGRAQFTVGPEEKSPGKNFMKMNADTLKRPGPELARDLDADLKKNGLVSKDLGLQEGKITSDTGEITRDWKRGLLLIDTPRTKSFSGFPVEPVKMGDVTFTLAGPFATIAVQSLENEAIGKAKKILLTAVARVENDKDVMSYGQTVPNTKGGLRGERIMVTTADATVSISGGDLKVTPIAADGSALEGAFVVPSRNGRAEIPLGKNATIWYVCERI